MLAKWIVSLLSLGSVFASAKPVDNIVAIVNDQIVTASDAEAFRRTLSNGGMVDETLVQLNDPKKMLSDRNALLHFMIDERILDSEVKRKNLEVTIERVDQEIRDIMNKRRVNREQMKEVLRSRGISMAEYQDYLKKSLERHSLIEKEVYSKIRISDEDIASYYAAKKGNAKNQAYEYTISHIVVIPKKGNDAAARKKAQEAHDKLKAGQAFDSVAERYSEDPNFAGGGALGTFHSGEMQGDIENAVKKLQSGEFSPVVRTKMGYNIFKVVKRTLIADPGLQAQKDELRGLLTQEALKKQLRIWLKERREDAFIKINGWT